MPNKKNLWIILAINLLNAVGLTIVIPLFPFLIGKYVPINQIALYLGMLISTYAVCQFFASPVMGALSDYFGRKPILILSLLGTAVGYFTLGIGGAIWVFFLGRIIDGLTAGDVSTLYAYIADSTEGTERTKYYGYLGAANGIGFMIGPAIGGLLGIRHLSLPFYVAAGVSIITALLIYFFLPETVSKDKRVNPISFKSFNTFSHFKDILFLKEAWAILLLGSFFFFGMLFYQSNISVFLKNVFHWGPAYIGAFLAVVGACDIISRGFLLPKLLVFPERNVGLVGLGSMVLGLLGGLTGMVVLLWVAVVFITLGEGLFDPLYNNMLSHSVSEDKQGQLQGVNQSLHSVYQILGPLAAGVLYFYSSISVYAVAALCMLITFLCFSKIRMAK